MLQQRVTVFVAAIIVIIVANSVAKFAELLLYKQLLLQELLQQLQQLLQQWATVFDAAVMEIFAADVVATFARTVAAAVISPP